MSGQCNSHTVHPVYRGVSHGCQWKIKYTPNSVHVSYPNVYLMEPEVVIPSLLSEHRKSLTDSSASDFLFLTAIGLLYMTVLNISLEFSSIFHSLNQHKVMGAGKST